VFNIIIGNNKWVNTDGRIVYKDDNGKDKELLKYELSADSKPLVTVEIRDIDGKLLGKIDKSTTFTNIDPKFEAEESHNANALSKIVLRRKEDKKIYFELTVHSLTDFEINGVFHVKEIPYTIVVDGKGITMGHGALISECTFENHGNAVFIT
jgi:hypothetical protein